MKKIFGFIGMWLMAMTLCCSFMACSSDDGEEERSEGVNGGTSVNGGGKRLVSITETTLLPEWYSEKYEIIERRFEYDKLGRIVRDIGDERTTTYEYGEAKIIATTRDLFMGSSDRREYSLKNGRIVKSTTDYGTSVYNEEYEYDGNKLLNKKIIHGTAPYNVITWDGDNIATWGNAVYIYSNIESAIGWHDCYDINYVDEVLFNQGYFGARPRNLVAAVGGRKYKYEVNDGYVTKKVTDTITTEYVWE